MNKLEETQLYHDTASLDRLRKAGQNNEEGALRQAAEHFESIFMNMMLKSMRKANDVLADSDSPFNSQSVKFYRGMYDEQLATHLSSTGALGLADIIVDQLGPNKDKFMPGEMMRSDGFRPGVMDQNLTQLFSTDNENEDKQPEPLAALVHHSQAFQQHTLKIADEQLKQQSNQQVATHEKKEEKEFKDKQDFVDKLLPVAEKVSQAIGLPAIAMVAQAALETGWGQRMMNKPDGSNAFNFFGIKADNRWDGDSTTRLTQEFKFGQMQTEVAKFRAYDDIEQGLSDYVSFVGEQSRYKKAVEVAAEPKAYFEQLQKAGYATDPNYAQKILSVLKDKVFENTNSELKY